MTAENRVNTIVHCAAPTQEWWRSAVIYQVYPRSFADGNGDGMGDLKGIISKLAYLKDPGVDALWVSPFYPSPQADGGYDVSDYRDIDPIFGTLEDADRLVERAHKLGLRVVVDLVPNHTSDEHPWLQRALTSAPDSPERDWCIFRDWNKGAPAYGFNTTGESWLPQPEVFGELAADQQ